MTRALGVSHLFGAIPLLRDLPPASHARLAAAAREWRAPPATVVQEVLVEASAFREALFGAFAGRLAGLLTLLEELVSRRLDRRLAALLIDRGPVLHATHQQLADELVSAREVISRLLESFEVHGYVRLHRGRIEVSNRQELANLANG